MTRGSLTRAKALDASEDIGRNPGHNASIGDVITARLSRRSLLKGTLSTATIAAAMGPAALAAGSDTRGNFVSRFKFADIGSVSGADHRVAAGYDADILIRWGDPVLPGAPSFDPSNQSAAAQKRQFGYNNDFLGYLPMRPAANPSQHGLLVVNFETADSEIMLARSGVRRPEKTGKEIAAIEMAAHGGAVIEIKRVDGRWQVVEGSRYARRIDVDTTMELTGPAAGHDRLTTKADPSGRSVRGMINNCGGGITPWGTWLSCEENFHGYFGGKLAEDHPEARSHQRYGVGAGWYAWGRWHDRFDLGREPNEANRFGWIVEIDPFDPASTPRKRTALGRFKHEGAAGIINRDGRYVIYMGDDERFEYVYRFITDAAVDLSDPAANRHVLDRGTLCVARYNADGTADWLPLVHGAGPLTPANGFRDQADVLIEARRAADLLGATRMDRPEDVEANPKTGKVYVNLTGNPGRETDQVDAANPRAANRFGHIIEMTPPGSDHAASRFGWDILVKCDPRMAAAAGCVAMPDNIAIDGQGRLWVATDGNSPATTGRADGLWAVETDGPLCGTSRQFYAAPAGAELCGPAFTPNDETLFVAVQHPGNMSDIARGTAWPDFRPGVPPRPSVVVITKRGGGKIGV